MRYINIGCYWDANNSKKSNENYLLNIFLKYGVAFAFNRPPNKYINEGKKDHIISISDGSTIIAVGRALSDLNLLEKIIDDFDIKFTPEELCKFEINDDVVGLKLKLYKLKEQDFFNYGNTNRVTSIQFISDRLKEVQDKISYFLKKYEGIEMIEKSIELLKQNKNLILTGAPGTGKTYLAKQIASKLCLGEYYEVLMNDEKLSEDEKSRLKKDFEHQCGFVQFHPSYDYTDFVEGLRPVNNVDKNIGFERRDGVFKEFCKRALLYPIIIKYLIPYFISLSDDLKKNKEYTLTGFQEIEIAPFISIKFFDVYNNSIDNISNINDSNFQIHIKIGTKDKPELAGHINEYVYWYILFKKRLKENNFTVSNFAKEINQSWIDSYVCALLKDFDDKYSKKIEREIKNIGIEKVQEKNFVFIIDEINRGEISKIFGELFFSIDPGYRGKKGQVKTQYQNLIKDDIFENGFYIPENVYIIGTMNDIDRSVESMDFAMRRRFAWLLVEPENTQSMLDNMFKNVPNREDFIEQIKQRMDSLNTAIENIEDLSNHYKIGASYFLKLENYYDKSKNNIEEAFKCLWNYHLKGLLSEYLRGNPEEGRILTELEESYNMLPQDKKDNTVEEQEKHYR